MPIDAKKILTESGAYMLARELENNNTDASAYMSRVIGIAYIRAIADFCVNEEPPVCTYWLKRFADLYEKSMTENTPLIELIIQWKEVIAELKIRKIQLQVYDYSYFALSAVTEWLVPDYWDHESSGEWTEVDLNECSHGAAARVLDCFFEIYIRLQPSVQLQKRIAETAINEEKKWRIGTKTEFRLVEDAVLKDIENHIFELEEDELIEKAFDKLVASITLNVL